MMEWFEAIFWIFAGIFVNEFIRYFQKVAHKKGQSVLVGVSRKFEKVNKSIEKTLVNDNIDYQLYYSYKRTYINELKMLIDNLTLDIINSKVVINEILDKSEDYNELLNRLRIRLEIDEKPFMVDNFAVKYLEECFCNGICQLCQFKVCKKYLEVEQ